MSENTNRSNASIRNHTGFAMAAAVVPIPFADIGAITAVEIDMLRALTKIYGLNWSDGVGKQLVGIAAAIAIGTGIWASLSKFIPGVGTVVGGAIQMSIAGSVCYALGKTYQAHLESGGEVIDAGAFKKAIKGWMKEGEKVADELKDDVKKNKYKR